MRNSFTRASNFLVLFTISAMAACSGGASTSAPGIPAFAPISAAGATAVVVTVQRNSTPLSGIPVDLYTGHESTKCKGLPPGFTCVVKDKSLAHGTTRKNGKVTLRATFSSSELVCAQADSSSGWVQKCETRFPSSVLLQFK
jgi:hypothetical protein